MQVKGKLSCHVCGHISATEVMTDKCCICGSPLGQIPPIVQRPIDYETLLMNPWQCSICGNLYAGIVPPRICPNCADGPSLLRENSSPKVTGRSAGEHILIIGSGIAGVTAAAQARITSDTCRITLIEREHILPYYRINLTRYIAGDVIRDKLNIHPESWYAERDIQLVIGDVQFIHRLAKQVLLNSSQLVHYDKLIIANGSHAFVPAFPGGSKQGVFVFRTMDDAEKIIARSEKGKSCICIGGGILGIETASALCKGGVEVTIVGGSGHLLSRQLPERAGQLLKEHLEKQGVKVKCGVRVTEILGDRSVSGIRLSSGEEVMADYIIISAGIRPTTYLARECGLSVNCGIVVNNSMQTSDANIYAAGDVAEHEGRIYGLWRTSLSQGKVAGICAAGGCASFMEVTTSNVVKVIDVGIFSIGEVSAVGVGYQAFECGDHDRYIYLLSHDNYLVGAALYGDVKLAGTLRKAVDQHLALTDLILINLAFSEVLKHPL